MILLVALGVITASATQGMAVTPTWQFSHVTCSSVDMGRYGNRLNATCMTDWSTAGGNAFKFKACLSDSTGCHWVTSPVAWATRYKQYRSASWNPNGFPQYAIVYAVWCDDSSYPATCIPA